MGTMTPTPTPTDNPPALLPQWIGFVYNLSNKEQSEKVRIIRELYGYSYVEKKQTSGKRGKKTKSYPRKVTGILTQTSAWKKLNRNILAVPSKDRDIVENFFKKNDVSYYPTSLEAPPTQNLLKSIGQNVYELSASKAIGITVSDRVRSHAREMPSHALAESVPDTSTFAASLANEIEPVLNNRRELDEPARRRLETSAGKLMTMVGNPNVPEVQQAKFAEAASLIFRALYELTGNQTDEADRDRYLDWIRRSAEILRQKDENVLQPDRVGV